MKSSSYTDQHRNILYFITSIILIVVGVSFFVFALYDMFNWHVSYVLDVVLIMIAIITLSFGCVGIGIKDS